MELQDLEPNAQTYHELLSCYGRGGAYRQAEQLFTRIREAGIAPDDIICSCRALTVRVLWRARGDGQG
eukprot:358053-Pyramimonas_sp.AAC.3